MHKSERGLMCVWTTMNYRKWDLHISKLWETENEISGDDA